MRGADYALRDSAKATYPARAQLVQEFILSTLSVSESKLCHDRYKI